MRKNIRILFATSEAHPLMKTGGLADVAGSLPVALKQRGFDIRLLMPAYPGTIELTNAKAVFELMPFSRGWQVQIYQGIMPNTDVPVYLIKNDELYQRDGSPYSGPDGHDWPDNALRFGILSKVAALFGSNIGCAEWLADIIHCNDWQAGLAPAYLQLDPTGHARSLFSIHNLAFHGNFPVETLQLLDLPRSIYTAEGIEFFHQVSFLKAGIKFAEHISTVSPTYADEIQTEEFGYGMEGLLKWRQKDLSGIVNGIDESHWNPRTDTFLPHNYSASDLQGKSAMKKLLQERVGLEPNPDIPVLGMVGRMTWQKGCDLIIKVADELVKQPLQLIILGSGNAEIEMGFKHLMQAYPDKVHVTIGYSEELSHWVEAGCDMFLMPSRFEPCGLNQMYSMAYGTPPIVRNTGGLADTVVDASALTLKQKTATGFVFQHAEENEFIACVLRALLAFESKKIWRQIRCNGMRQDFSWSHSAEAYAELYEQMSPQQ